MLMPSDRGVPSRSVSSGRDVSESPSASTAFVVVVSCATASRLRPVSPARPRAEPLPPLPPPLAEGAGSVECDNGALAAGAVLPVAVRVAVVADAFSADAVMGASGGRRTWPNELDEAAAAIGASEGSVDADAEFEVEPVLVLVLPAPKNAP